MLFITSNSLIYDIFYYSIFSSNLQFSGATMREKPIEVNSSERSSSGQDDGYGTESGSNHKVLFYLVFNYHEDLKKRGDLRKCSLLITVTLL